MTQAAITLLILGLVVVVFILDRLPVMVVALSVPVVLWMTGILELGDAFASFGDPTVIFIASLFVVSEALDATGITAWVGDLALRVAGTSRTRLLVVIMLMVAIATAIITPNGSVAALTPVVVLIAVRAKRSPSDLLLPLALGAHAGSVLMLTGSPVNLVIADYVAEVGGGQLGLFTFSILGAALVLGTVILVVLLGPKLIPTRTARRALQDLGSHATVLSEHYDLADPASLMNREIGLMEAQIPPRSTFVGQHVYAGMRTTSGKLIVVAAQHRGKTKLGVHPLQVGDTILFRGDWDDLDTAAQDPNILVVNDPERVRRQAIPLGRGTKPTLIILAVMALLLATNVVPAAIAGLGAALALIITRAVSVQQVYEGMGWTTLILVGGLMPLASAMEISGAADLLADWLVSIVYDWGPYGLLAGLFVVTTMLGQLISNMATTFIVVPVGLAAAAQMDISPMPVLLSILVFAAAALLTPIATPANLVVTEAAGYKFDDFWKMGTVLMALYGAVGIWLVPSIWPF